MTWYVFLAVIGGLGLIGMALAGIDHGGDGHGGHGHSDHGGHGDRLESYAWALFSPRVLFAWALGVGVVGLAVRPFLFEPLTALVAIGGGFAFERLFVAKLWRFMMNFGSKPGQTLDLCVMDSATAITNFDQSGDGVIKIELDGQVRQLLGSLAPAEKALGVQIKTGDRLRIEEINTKRGSCTVARYDAPSGIERAQIGAGQ